MKLKNQVVWSQLKCPIHCHSREAVESLDDAWNDKLCQDASQSFIPTTKDFVVGSFVICTVEQELGYFIISCFAQCQQFCNCKFQSKSQGKETNRANKQNSKLGAKFITPRKKGGPFPLSYENMYDKGYNKFNFARKLDTQWWCMMENWIIFNIHCLSMKIFVITNLEIE